MLPRRARPFVARLGRGRAHSGCREGSGSAVSSNAKDHVRGLLGFIGEDTNRAGIADTPRRYAQALLDVTQGSRRSLSEVVGRGVFEESYDQMLVVRDIEFYSMCEHHMLPFFGRVHIGYLPSGRVLGLSKLVRIVDLYAQRLSMQERLTREVAEAIDTVASPQGVAVVIEAQHLCMAMRGVRRASTTSTSCMLGGFKSDARTRSEFLSLVNSGSSAMQTPPRPSSVALPRPGRVLTVGASHAAEGAGSLAPRAEPQQKVTLRIAKEDMKFSAAHFTIFDNDDRERLHGHDHRVAVEVSSALGEGSMLGGMSYSLLKRRARALCAAWDESVLLPERSEHLSIEDAPGNQVVVRFGSDEMRFPADDVVLLPVENTTLEALAGVLADRLAADLSSDGLSGELALTVSGSPGHEAIVRRII